MSSRFPIGVATINKNFFKFLCVISLLCLIYSCTPRILSNEDIFTEKKDHQTKTHVNQKNSEQSTSIIDETNNEVIIDETKNEVIKKINIINEIEIILPDNDNSIITNNFINSLELSLYKKNIKSLSFNLNTYSNKIHLREIINEKAEPGKIFIGPLTSSDTKQVKEFCIQGVLFFSFASDRSLANDCIYLINFFPEDELQTLFNYFNSNSRIALLYPENQYGYYINEIINDIAAKSDVIIINRASYKEDLSNARNAIKELSKYELRKYELERQKKLLKNKNDAVSIKALKKIEKFETIGELDFTHVIIPDYNIRLLQVVPLLPFYDIDPNKIQFVGTGVWDEEVFFNEPSLQGAIFPGINKEKRKDYIEDYIKSYNEEPIRTVTIIHDLVGLLSFIVENKMSLDDVLNFLNDYQISFEGLDGKFSFKNNLIKRDLEILQILDGVAISIR